MMVSCRPSDSDVIDSVGDDDDDITKASSSCIPHGNKPIATATSGSASEVLRTSLPQQAPSVEFVNEKPSSTVSNAAQYAMASKGKGKGKRGFV